MASEIARFIKAIVLSPVSCMLDTELQSWFLNAKNVNQAKDEILALFSEEPGDGYIWSEQDIWGQSRKIIDRWNSS